MVDEEQAPPSLIFIRLRLSSWTPVARRKLDPFPPRRFNDRLGNMNEERRRLEPPPRCAITAAHIARGPRSRMWRGGCSAHSHHCLRRLLLVLVAVVSVSCSSEAATPKPPTTVLLPDGGTLYVGAGPSGFAQDLYRIRGDGRTAPEQVTALPPGRNLSVLTAGSGQVIVSEATEGTDKIARLVGNRLERLIDDRVFTPSLSDDGRLAYVRLREAVGQPNVDFVVVRDLASSEERNLYQHTGGSLSYPAWAPGSLLAVVEKDGPTLRQARIVLIGADGTVRKVELGERASTGLVGSQRAPHLVVRGNGPPPSQFLLDPALGHRDPLPPGWVPLTWSPDGSSLLVANGRRLGLIRPPDLARVDEVGNFPQPVWQADWVLSEAETASPDGTPSRAPTKETP